MKTYSHTARLLVLSTLNRSVLDDAARKLELRGFSKLNKARLVKSLAKHPTTLEDYLGFVRRADLEKLARAVGIQPRSRMTVPALRTEILSKVWESDTTRSRQRRKQARSAGKPGTKSPRAKASPTATRHEPDYSDRLNLILLWASLIEVGAGASRVTIGKVRDVTQQFAIRPADTKKVELQARKYSDPLPFAAKIESETVRRTLLADLLASSWADGEYRAQEREGIRRLAGALSVPWYQIEEAEDAFAADAGKALATTKKSQGVTAKKQDPWRSYKIAAGVLLGGVAVGVTGGLAAPAVGGAIGSGVLGLSGVAATNAGLAALGGGAIASGGLGMAGGTAAITSLFGAAGAGVVGRKVAKRTAGVTDFGIPYCSGKSTHIWICCSGFLTQNESPKTAWKPVREVLPYGEHRVIDWERKKLLHLGTAIGSASLKGAAAQAGKQFARKAAKNPAKALTWPMVILSAAGVIDNPWSVARDCADKAALELAAYLRERHLGRRPVSLIGHSLGARLILRALQDLAATDTDGLVDNVILMGTAASPSKKDWKAARNIVSGRFINAYSPDDWVLHYLYRSTELAGAAGIQAIKIKGIEDYDAVDLVGGHLGYRKHLPELLSELGFASSD